MVPYTALFRYAVLAVFLIIAMWQCSLQILYFRQEPLKITKKQVPVNYTNFRVGQVCTASWMSTDVSDSELPVLAYALGYLVNTNLYTIRNTTAYKVANNPDFYNSTKKAYDHFKLAKDFNWVDFTFLKTGVRSVHKAKRRGTIQQALTMMPHYSSNQMACGVIGRYAAQSYSLTRLESFGGYVLRQRPSFRIITPKWLPVLSEKGGGEIINLFTLYVNPFWKFLSVTEHYFPYSISDTVSSKQKSEQPTNSVPAVVIKGSVTIQKSEHVLNAKKHPCTPVEAADRYPVGFGIRICQILCEEEAIKETYGCSALNLLEIPNYHSDLEPCNVYDYLQNSTTGDPFDKYAAVDKLKQKCFKKNECGTKVFCTEWDIIVSGVQVSKEQKPFHGSIKKSNESFQMINLFFLPSMSITTEELMFNWEGIIGNLGGIIGIWLGASALAILDSLVQRVAKWFRSKNKTKMDNEDEMQVQ